MPILFGGFIVVEFSLFPNIPVLPRVLVIALFAFLTLFTLTQSLRADLKGNLPNLSPSTRIQFVALVLGFFLIASLFAWRIDKMAGLASVAGLGLGLTGGQTWSVLKKATP